MPVVPPRRLAEAASAACPERTPAPPARLPSDALIGAPVALDIRAASGRLVFSSGAAAAGGPEAQERLLRTEDFSVPILGETYRLSLQLDLSEHARLEQDLVRRVYFDDLTGLPNRRLISENVESMIRAGSDPFALAFIDIDGFKHVNDYFGHGVGDRLLARIGERLASRLRPSDLLARLSGDEFLLLLTPIRDQDSVACQLERLSQRLKEPFVVDGYEIFTSASIGVALYPRDGRSYDVLRTNADRAMYGSKGASKGLVRFYDSTMESAAAERNRLEQRLRLAIRDRRIRCAYQPKIDFRTGEISGIEVLMRWINEDGLIEGPCGIIELATELGLMDDITHDILEQTIRSIDEINAAFGRGSSISLNLEARQAADFDFMRGLINAIDRTGFADRFMLELTEEAFLPKHQFQKHILPLIRSVGARVSIDDFGVGYSSLAALADITADELKVDRSFITDVHRKPRSQSVLKAIEALGTSLGMTIVVEGVETAEELDYLRAATGISYAQGFCFSRPVLLDAPAEARLPASDGRHAMPLRGVRAGSRLPHALPSRGSGR